MSKYAERVRDILSTGDGSEQRPYIVKSVRD